MAMDVLERLNRRFGTWYESLLGGGGTREGGGELRPRDILRRIVSAMEDERREGLDGRIYVPNVYTLQIAVESDDERDYLRTFLDAEELAAAVREAADSHGYGMRGPLVFAVEETDTKTAAARGDRVHIRCRFDAAPSAASAPAAAPSPAAPPAPAPSIVPDDDDSEPGTIPALRHDPILATLVVRGPDGRLQDVYPLTARGAQIGRGRSAGNDIVITADGMISKSHARVRHESGGFEIEDLGSTNGTFIGERRLAAGERAPLRPGDRVRIGETELLFRPNVAAQRVQDPALTPLPPLSQAKEGEFVQRTVAAVGETDNLKQAARETRPPVSDSPLSLAREGQGVRANASHFRLVAGDGETFPLASEMTVGRALTGDIVLIGNGVGSHHARLTVRDSGGSSVYVEDLGTPGGTTVNGERIPVHFPVALYDGDLIAFGEVQLRLERAASGGGAGR